MYEENTNDSATSTTDTPAATDQSATGTSTTEQTQTGSDQVDQPTLLTENPDGDDKGGDKQGGDKQGGDKQDGDKQDGDDKGGDDKGGDDKGGNKPAENADLFGAPEGEYEIEGLPEGMTVDKEALAAVEPVARELGLSNKGMSKLAGVYAEHILPKVVDQFQTQLQQDIAAQHATWATEALEMIKTDEQFKGKQLKEIQQVSAKALDRLGSSEFRKFLDETGLGNHPAMLRFAYLAGSAISEDTTFERGGTPAAKKSSVEKFYGPQS